MVSVKGKVIGQSKMEPLVSIGQSSARDSKETKANKGRHMLKALCAKVKICRKTCNKKDCKSMNSSAVSTDANVILLKENEKFVLRRSSFQEISKPPPSHYENLSKLVFMSYLNKNEDIANGSVAKGDSNDFAHERLENVEPAENGFPRFRRERRNAISEVTPHDREFILHELRFRALTRSLRVNGLIKL